MSKGRSYGAFTILNGALCGKGSAVGAELVTEAEFYFANEQRNVIICNDPKENDRMARECVRRTFEYAMENEPKGWELITRSEIPISRGMKSSSSACNAIVLSVVDSISFSIEDIEAVRIGVECARRSGVTVTGAFDDACACHFGGVVITDNMKDEMLHHEPFEKLDVMFCVPERKIRKDPTIVIDAHIRRKAEELARNAENDPFGVMNRNGVMMSSLLGMDRKIEKTVMEHGALAAGITGFGPAIAIVAEYGEGREILKDSGVNADIITTTRTRK